MEVDSEDKTIIQDGDYECPLRAKSSLIHTPRGFQDPSQLLQLKKTWFHHLCSSYHLHVRLLEHRSCVDHLSTHCAVIGLTSAPGCYPVIEGSPWNLYNQLLSSVLGVRFDTLFSCLPQQCCSEEVQILDKLDLIECLNHPLARRRCELQAVVEEDLHSIELRTRTFELEFDSFLQKLEPASNLFDVALSSLIDTSPTAIMSIGEATQALRQHIYWINSSLLAAFINISGINALHLNSGDGNTVLIQLQREDEASLVLLCTRGVNPVSVLHWYEQQLAQGVPLLLAHTSGLLTTVDGNVIGTSNNNNS